MYVIPLPEGRLLISLLILLNAHFIRMNVARATEDGIGFIYLFLS